MLIIMMNRFTRKNKKNGIIFIRKINRLRLKVKKILKKKKAAITKWRSNLLRKYLKVLLINRFKVTFHQLYRIHLNRIQLNRIRKVLHYRLKIGRGILIHPQAIF